MRLGEWRKVADMGKIRDETWFTACALAANIYVCEASYQEDAPCWAFRTSDFGWEKVSSIGIGRFGSACCAFRGKVVVSGGMVAGMVETDAVEAYCHLADDWARMPGTVRARRMHGQAAVGDKLFVVGSEDCEVFDSTSRQFALISEPMRSRDVGRKPFQVVSVGKRIVVFDCNSVAFLCYDVEKDEWSEGEVEGKMEICRFACAKVPKLSIEV